MNQQLFKERGAASVPRGKLVPVSPGDFHLGGVYYVGCVTDCVSMHPNELFKSQSGVIEHIRPTNRCYVITSVQKLRPFISINSVVFVIIALGKHIHLRAPAAVSHVSLQTVEI